MEVSGKVRNVLLITGGAILLFLAWYFSSIVAYILISALLSLIGRPLVRLLEQVKYKWFRISKGLAALITLATMWVLLAGFFSFLIPLLVNEFDQLSGINIDSVINTIENAWDQLVAIGGGRQVYTHGQEFSLSDVIINQLKEWGNFSHLQDVFKFIANTLGSLFVALFSISFISFFFLRDENLFNEIVMMFVPTQYEEKFTRMLDSIYKLLKRYLIGLILQILMVGLLATIGLTIVGIGFSHAVTIGLFCGLFNVIPYLGPWIGATLGLLIGVAINLQEDFMSHTLPILFFMILVFIIVQLIDNVVFQPLIYSSSVKAHPLEIFIVILIAANIGGIIGMILAIPAYTILRVIAREFMYNVKFVRKLTRSLE